MTEVLSPASPQDAAAALAEATAARASVNVVGGGTRSRRGRPGPPPDRELRTAGLRAVVAHEPADLTVTVEAGLPATDLAELAASAGQSWPQADIRPGSTVGGVLAAAASGRERLRMGAVRDSLLEVVLATGDGRLVTGGGRTVKGVAGYDIPRLAVGSLGTLGAIVQVTLKLWPIPAARGWFGAEGPLRRARRRRRPRAGRPGAAGLGAAHCRARWPWSWWARRRTSGRPEGMAAARRAARPSPRAAGMLEAGVPPPRLGELVARLEDAALGYEARMGVGTCLVAVDGRRGRVARARACRGRSRRSCPGGRRPGRPPRRPLGPAAARP